MDDASADLILTLQLQDLADLAADHDGEGTEDETPGDFGKAQDLYREELRNYAAVISDHRFGEKIGEATGEEPSSPFATVTPTFDQMLVNISGIFTVEASSAKRDKASIFDHWDTDYHNCVICTDRFPARCLITAPCGDHYCKTCIGQLYDLAMKDESLFPPQCCRQPITLEIATPMLNEVQVEKFLEKRVEHDTLDRKYCHVSTCGAFIPANNIIGEKATCTCGALTCTVCKAAAHEGDCPKDPAYASLMALAAGEGYQRCQQCKRLVELSVGCNHITCLCGAHFCYVCGAAWKQCLCPYYEEDHLMNGAQVVADRAPALFD